MTIEQVNARQIIVRATCELCGTRMNRCGLLEGLPDLERECQITTRSLRLDNAELRENYLAV